MQLNVCNPCASSAHKRRKPETLELVSNIIFAMEDMHMLFAMDGINVSHNYSQDASKDKPLITWAIQLCSNSTQIYIYHNIVKFHKRFTEIKWARVYHNWYSLLKQKCQHIIKSFMLRPKFDPQANKFVHVLDLLTNLFASLTSQLGRQSWVIILWNQVRKFINQFINILFEK